jgi:mono/diheme cytochrome c family protein
MRLGFLWAITAAVAGSFTALSTGATTPAQQLNQYRAASSDAVPSVDRGQALFTARHGAQWACASCHGAAPIQTGRHASTGKPIAPLAPAFNAQRFTDTAKTEKWFRRNCNDVLGRECTAAEKADVLAWLMTYKR